MHLEHDKLLSTWCEKRSMGSVKYLAGWIPRTANTCSWSPTLIGNFRRTHAFTGDYIHKDQRRALTIFGIFLELNVSSLCNSTQHLNLSPMSSGCWFQNVVINLSEKSAYQSNILSCPLHNNADMLMAYHPWRSMTSQEPFWLHSRTSVFQIIQRDINWPR